MGRLFFEGEADHFKAGEVEDVVYHVEQMLAVAVNLGHVAHEGGGQQLRTIHCGRQVHNLAEAEDEAEGGA